jgi:hypothetical protein
MGFGLTIVVLPENGIREKGYEFKSARLVSSTSVGVEGEIVDLVVNTSFRDSRHGLIAFSGSINSGGDEFTNHPLVLV